MKYTLNNRNKTLRDDFVYDFIFYICLFVVLNLL